MGGWGHNQKITTKCHEIKRIPTLTSSKTSLENAKARYGDFFTAIHSHLTLALLQLEKEEGVNPPPPIQGGGERSVLAIIKLYLQICIPTIKTVPSRFLLNL